MSGGMAFLQRIDICRTFTASLHRTRRADAGQGAVVPASILIVLLGLLSGYCFR
jgi:hypothetical protein